MPIEDKLRGGIRAYIYRTITYTGEAGYWERNNLLHEKKIAI